MIWSKVRRSRVFQMWQLRPTFSPSTTRVRKEGTFQVNEFIREKICHKNLIHTFIGEALDWCFQDLEKKKKSVHAHNSQKTFKNKTALNKMDNDKHIKLCWALGIQHYLHFQSHTVNRDLLKDEWGHPRKQ